MEITDLVLFSVQKPGPFIFLFINLVKSYLLKFVLMSVYLLKCQLERSDVILRDKKCNVVFFLVR